MCGITERTRECPRIRDDALDGRPRRLPPEFLHGALAGGDERRRVSSTARRFNGWDRLASDGTTGLDHFTDTEPVTTAKIEDSVVTWLIGLRRQDVGISEVTDVDVIADRSAVLRGPIVSEDADLSLIHI